MALQVLLRVLAVVLCVCGGAMLLVAVVAVAVSQHPCRSVVVLATNLQCIPCLFLPHQSVIQVQRGVLVVLLWEAPWQVVVLQVQGPALVPPCLGDR